jgi:hypothetical protein
VGGFEPGSAYWRLDGVSTKQRAFLRALGGNTKGLRNKGDAADAIDVRLAELGLTELNALYRDLVAKRVETGLLTAKPDQAQHAAILFMSQESMKDGRQPNAKAAILHAIGMVTPGIQRSFFAALFAPAAKNSGR